MRERERDREEGGPWTGLGLRVPSRKRERPEKGTDGIGGKTRLDRSRLHVFLTYLNLLLLLLLLLLLFVFLFFFPSSFFFDFFFQPQRAVLNFVILGSRILSTPNECPRPIITNPPDLNDKHYLSNDAVKNLPNRSRMSKENFGQVKIEILCDWLPPLSVTHQRCPDVQKRGPPLRIERNPSDRGISKASS